MKNYLIISAAVLLFAACNRAEVEKGAHENDSLLAIVNERNAVIGEFISTVNELESNLDSVAVRQHVITVNAESKGEFRQDQKTRINNEITAINKLMEENREKISDLTKKLRNSKHKNADLEKMIVTMNNQLTQKNTELAELNVKLINLNVEVTRLQTTVAELANDNSVKAQVIAEDTKSMHTAYYVVGKSNELKDAKIIDRKGGLLGIGRTSLLSGDFDNSRFTRIDYTQMNNIPVNSEMKMITSHPSDSYKLEKDVKNKDITRTIVILNPEKFWSASKYLVVVKD